MLQMVFSVYDSKAEIFAQPMFMRTIGEAIRAWEAAIQDPNLDLNKHPADFTLFHIGSYDQSTGLLSVLEHGKVSYGTALESLPTTPPQLTAEA